MMHNIHKGPLRPHLLRLQIQPDSVIHQHRMSIRIASLPSPLKVFPTDETSVDVDVGHADGTEAFKVEVEDGVIDL